MSDDTNPTESNDANQGGEATPAGPLHHTTTLLLTFGAMGAAFAEALHADAAVIGENEDAAKRAHDAQLAELSERIDFEVRNNHAMELRIAALEERVTPPPGPFPTVADVLAPPMLDVVWLPELPGAVWVVEPADTAQPHGLILQLAHTLVAVPRATAGQVYRLRPVAAG